MASTKRLIPTGDCWCGCGAETAIGAFFLPGHDKAPSPPLSRSSTEAFPDSLCSTAMDRRERIPSLRWTDGVPRPSVRAERDDDRTTGKAKP